MWGRFEPGNTRGTEESNPIAVSVPPRASTDCPLLQLMYMVNDKLPCTGCAYYSKRLIILYYVLQSRSMGSPEASDRRDDIN